MDKRKLWKILLSLSAEKIRKGTLRCFIESWVSENFMHKGGGGGITNPVGIFLSHSTKKLRREPFSV